MFEQPRDSIHFVPRREHVSAVIKQRKQHRRQQFPSFRPFQIGIGKAL